MEPIRLPIPPSVNHCYRNAMLRQARRDGVWVRRRIRLLTPKAKAWMRQAHLVANARAHKDGWKIPEAGVKVVVSIVAVWPDRRRRDVHNLHKLIADALEGIVYVDDRYALIRDEDYRTDKHDPHVEISWRVSEV